MVAKSQANLLIFRETRTELPPLRLLQELSQILEGKLERRESVIDGLIRAGELECGLLDANVPEAEVKTIATLTDDLAALLISPDRARHEEIHRSLKEARSMALPPIVQVSPPEGFLYYALHPSDFADLATKFPAATSVLVIGVRSIGTTLSAIFSAGLKSQGKLCNRTTVRPTGHPYDRCTQFSEEQIQLIVEANRHMAEFVVVDEGPGLSGSSFLSVGEALVAQGVAPDHITMIGTRTPDASTLRAKNGHRRWNRFCHATVDSEFYRKLFQEHFCRGQAWGGGAWRESLLGPEESWPACWPQMERLKVLVAEGNSLLKFDGLGRFGHQVRERADSLFRAGFGPAVEDAGDGLSAYCLIPGKPLNRGDVSTSVLERMAAYCAFRASAFRTSGGERSPLPEMVRHNLKQELNQDWSAAPESLESSNCIISDGRMQPEEWICTPTGELLKVDAGTHGDDHFMPGPVDIAWDLAGTIVEWNLDRDAQTFFVTTFNRLSGDNPEARLPAFVIAYAAFRLAYSEMAQLALQFSSEQPRWQRARQFYLGKLMRELPRGIV